MEDLVGTRARASPDAPALAGPGETWTYAELDRAVDDVARRLATAGLGPSSRVATLVPNRPEAVIAVHAVGRAGATLAPLNWRSSQRELVEHLDLLAPSVVLCCSQSETLASLVVKAPAIINLDRSRGTRAVEIARFKPARLPPPGLAACAVHTVVATSGTSGRPHGVELTLGNHLSSARAVIERLGLGPRDRWLLVLGLDHVGGLALVLRAALAGSAVIVRERFDEVDVNGLVDAGEVSHVSLVPTMLHRLLRDRGGRAAPASLRCVVLGGAPATQPLVEAALKAGFPLALTYGLTEAASQVATCPPDLVRRKPGTVGRPLSGIEVRLDVSGEVLVGGPTVMRGYVGHDPSPVREGWLHTGDLGRVDADGDLWIVGRLSERIISGGINVEPAEVEAVLLMHPAVSEAAVVGLPDDEWGEIVGAGVVPQVGADPTADELGRHCEPLLSGPKRPRRFVLVGGLPRNANGKVDRAAVVRLFRPEALSP